MKCKICDTEMDIDGWGGLWMCFNCGFVGGKATSKEIEKWEINGYNIPKG